MPDFVILFGFCSMLLLPCLVALHSAKDTSANPSSAR
jgi:hypothetical protein